MRIFSIFLFVAFQFSLLAQTRTISGIVTDESGAPLIGASVIWEGTDKGVVTDFEGAFEIEVVDEKVILTIAYTGYETVEKLVKKTQNYVRIKMSSGVALDEVVVTGMHKKRMKKDRIASYKSTPRVAYDVAAPAAVSDARSFEAVSSSTTYSSYSNSNITAGQLTEVMNLSCS
ncbi:MAG: carboxypeptidase-like regulatory domain-containing protein [Bacteroidota bacterium]